jgi:iron complex outermembrane recepter protein
MPHRTLPRLSRLALTIAHLGLVPVLNLPAKAAEPASATTPRSYNIPAGPLEAALNRFGRETGILLSFPTGLAAGLQSPGLQGSHDANTGLARLLKGTGLAAQARPDGSFTLYKSVETSSQEPTLAPITVRAGQQIEHASGPLIAYAATRSATATKTDTAIIETPQSISVIGRQEMEARSAQDVMDVVRYTAGINTNIYGPDNRGWEDIQIRGFNTYYSGYRDGLAQTPAGVTYPLTEPYGLERVEVLRGPSSMVFGQGDAGGIINRISKQPADNAIREIEVQYGSFDRKQMAFDLGNRIENTDLSFRLTGLSLDSNDQDKYPDGHKLNRTRQYIAPSLRWQPNARTSLTILGEYLKNRSAEDPYYLNVGGNYTTLKMGDYSFSKFEQEQAMLGYKFETAINDNWTLQQSLRQSHIELKRNVVWVDSVDDDGHTIHRIARTWDDPLNHSTVDTHLLGRLRSGSAEHTVLAGVDWSRQTAHALRFIGSAPDLDLNAPVYGQVVTQPTTPLADYKQVTRQLGLYAQDQIKLSNKWVVTLGGRQDQVKSVTDDYLASTLTTQNDDAFSGRAGLTYLLGNGWAPYSSYAESFLPNSGTDAQNNPFKPSRGKQWELGMKFQPEGKKALFTVAVFDLNKTNVVTYDPVTFEGRQIGKQQSRGVELEAKGEVLRGLNATASYTLLNLNVIQSADPDEIGKKQPGVAARSAALWLDYLMRSGWGLGAGARYIGKRANDEYNTSFVGAVTLLDAAVHFEDGPWRLALNISNLLDRNYFSICYHGECYRGAERTATLTAKYSF